MGQGLYKAQMPYFAMTFPLTYKTLYPFILILLSPKAAKAMRRESCLDAIWTEDLVYLIRPCYG
jgi:hypothetical protein